VNEHYLAALREILVQGLPVTVKVSVASILIAICGGLVLGVLRALRNRALDTIIIGYVEVLRGIPLLVLMFFVFFGLPQLGFHFPEVPSAIIALGLWGAANGAEIVRGAIFSISSGQSEAGTALGLNWPQVMFQVILPQAVRRMIPPFMSLFVATVESSSLAALIGVKDIVEIVRLRVENDPSLWIPLLVSILLIYFFINYPVSIASQRLEKRLA
jgi:His/Glu/Gln/Arg/opine family amino acid ABC transporter permease subunit